MKKLCFPFRKAFFLETGGIISIVGAGGKTSLMHVLSRELSASGEPVLATTTTKVRIPEGGVFSKIIICANGKELLREVKSCGEKFISPVFAASGNISGQNKLTGLDPEAIERIAGSAIYKWIIVEADGASQRPLKAPAPHEPVIPRSTGWTIGVAGLDGIGKPVEARWVFRPERFAELTNIKMGEIVTEHSVAKALIHPEGIMKGSPRNARKIVFLNKADRPERVESGRKITSIIIAFGESTVERVVIGRLLETPSILECRDNERVRDIG
ncbi:MAG: hypothetical protein A2V65_05495 [Deltaproteobacteria bacterium RBG_13_49_15]|nr:MAG: hypothetical protein A2V65_05495 [Deltaproteobacteria bacterium RBG_13_49_15]